MDKKQLEQISKDAYSFGKAMLENKVIETMRFIYNKALREEDSISCSKCEGYKKAFDDYVLIPWPDSQELMEMSGFSENSYISENAPYFVKKEWLLRAKQGVLLNDQNKDSSSIPKQNKTTDIKRSLEDAGVPKEYHPDKLSPFTLENALKDQFDAIVDSAPISKIADFLLKLETSKSLSEEEFAILNSANPVKAAEKYLKRKGKL